MRTEVFKLVEKYDPETIKRSLARDIEALIASELLAERLRWTSIRPNTFWRRKGPDRPLRSMLCWVANFDGAYVYGDVMEQDFSAGTKLLRTGCTYSAYNWLNDWEPCAPSDDENWRRVE